MIGYMRRRAGLVLLLVQAALPGLAETESTERLKARVRQLHAKGNQVTVTMADRTVIRGEITRVADDSFTIRPENRAPETVVPFAQLRSVKKNGLSRKAILIPAAIAGGAVLILCAAPYPLGFLCHKDPS